MNMKMLGHKESRGVLKLEWNSQAFVILHRAINPST